MSKRVLIYALRYHPLEEKVWAHVDKSGDHGDHWLWMGPTSNGQPIINSKGRRFRAKRVIYSLVTGKPVTDDIEISSSCGLKLCVLHLIESPRYRTVEKKTQDMVRLFFAANPDKTNIEVARELGWSLSTTQKYRPKSSKKSPPRDRIRQILLKVPPEEVKRFFLGKYPSCKHCGEQCTRVSKLIYTNDSLLVRCKKCRKSRVVPVSDVKRRPTKIPWPKVQCFVELISAHKSATVAAREAGISLGAENSGGRTIIRLIEQEFGWVILKQ